MMNEALWKDSAILNNVISHSDGWKSLEKPLRKFGTLCKQGHIMPNWKERFFILDNGVLTYFANEDIIDIKGSIRLHDATLVVSPGYILITRQNAAAANEGHTYLRLYISQPSTQTDWVNATQSHIDFFDGVDTLHRTVNNL